MPYQKLLAHLDDNRVKYVTIRHSPAYTAQEIAALAHIPGKDVAKTVMLKVDDKLSMAVLPASQKVDIAHFAQLIRAKHVQLACEKEFADEFPGCELGAMPPFGNLWDMPVYVSKSLTEDEHIAFNAGTHTELIQLAYADYKRLVKPTVVDFAIAEYA